MNPLKVSLQRVNRL